MARSTSEVYHAMNDKAQSGRWLALFCYDLSIHAPVISMLGGQHARETNVDASIVAAETCAARSHRRK
jgi:hypothetical protein